MIALAPRQPIVRPVAGLLALAVHILALGLLLNSRQEQSRAALVMQPMSIAYISLSSAAPTIAAQQPHAVTPAPQTQPQTQTQIIHAPANASAMMVHSLDATPAPALVPVSTAVFDKAALLQAYDQRLWQHIAAYRPRHIQKRGVVQVGFQIGRQGQLLAVQLVQSSGYYHLDHMALRMIRQASPYPLPPEDLDDQQLHFVMAVNFE